jgi:hypothetical protein
LAAIQSTLEAAGIEFIAGTRQASARKANKEAFPTAGSRSFVSCEWRRAGGTVPLSLTLPDDGKMADKRFTLPRRTWCIPSALWTTMLLNPCAKKRGSLKKRSQSTPD